MKGHWIVITLLRNFITLVTTLTAVLLAVRELKKAFDNFRREPEAENGNDPKEIAGSKDSSTGHLCR